jgi:hypothetical protein
MFSNWVEMKEQFKTFSSYADTPLLANQYFNATTAGLAKSFAGFCTIERSMDASIALLYYLDVLGVSTNNKVLPNIGLENIGNFQNGIDQTTTLTPPTLAYNILLGKKLIPGTVKVYVTVAGVQSVIEDDGQGGIKSPPGLLASGSINYASGLVAFTFAAGTGIVGTDTARAIAVEDQVATDGINRFKAKLEHYTIETHPELLIAELDLPSLAAMAKVTGQNVATWMVGKMQELYTKLINKGIVRELITGSTGSNIVIQPNAGNNTTFRSTLDRFGAGLNKVDSELGIKSVKGINATAYVVGYDLATQFRDMKDTGKFVDTPQNYVDDLVGYYNGIPVMQHADVDRNQGYAIHKTADGQLAPIGRGLFLPLTSTPQIGNYNNPTQLAQGVYYQEKSKMIEPVLVQKFVLQP